MSTKTSIKRIAAVAAVALTLGGFSAVSAHATTTNTTAGEIAVTDAVASPAAVSTDLGATPAVTAATASGIAGANNFVGFTIGASTSSPIAVVVTGGTAVSSSSAVTGSGTGSLLIAKAASSSYVAFTIPTPTVGSIVLKTYTFSNGVQSSTATSSLTVTVAAALAGTVYDHSTVAIQNIASNTSAADIFADGTLTSIPATASANAVAQITVSQYSSTDSVTSLTDAKATAVTVAISGAGAVGAASTGGGATGITDAAGTRGPSATVAAAATSRHGASGDKTGLSTFYVFADGRSGTATITVTVNGVAQTAKTLTFTSTTVSSYKLDATTALAGVVAVNGTSTQLVNGYDANGNKIAAGAGTIYAVSADTTIATVSVSSQTVTVTGVKGGKTTVTICDTSACTAAVKTVSLPVVVGGTTAASVALSLDKASYLPGEKMTLTVTAKDSLGNPNADGATTVFTTDPTANVSIVGFPTFTSHQVTLAAGVATYTLYAPLSSGDVVISGTDNAATPVAIKATATVTNPSADAAQAAVDAANEATDAANAATDAANNAMDSADAAQQAALDAGDKADAALAAVTDLASKVADIATQISALSSLVSKIAASVAKISAKVKA